jgi:hypothetical protein
MGKIPKSYKQNVFINCPFDSIYSPLFNAIVFSVHYVGFRPRCALEASNAGQYRLEKIMKIISECKYSIHDLSRTQADAKTGLPRFNMPLELGLDLGCRRFGQGHHHGKTSLILDVKPYRYQKFISDIAGQDVVAHGGREIRVVEIVRDWLRLALGPHSVVASGAAIFKRYEKFQQGLPLLCTRLNWNPKKLQFADFSSAIATWIRSNPL